MLRSIHNEKFVWIPANVLYYNGTEEVDELIDLCYTGTTYFIGGPTNAYSRFLTLRSSLNYEFSETLLSELFFFLEIAF